MGKRTSFPEGKGTSTPWGPAQYSTQYCRGVVAYTTAGHGGMAVTINWAKKNLTPHAQHLGMPWGGRIWYEEDCKVSILFFEYPEFYLVNHPDAVLDCVALRSSDETSIRAYDPKYFDPEFQEQCRNNPVFDPADLIPGDEVSLGGIPYLVNLAADRKGRIQFADCWCNSNYVFQNLTGVKRNGAVIWQRPRIADVIIPARD